MRRKAGLTAAAVLALLLCVLFGGVLRQYALPMEDADYDLSLNWEGEAVPEDWVYDQKGWTVFTQEGDQRTELTADGFGGFLGSVEPGDTFYFSRPLTEELDSPVLRLDARTRAIAVFLDGVLLYTDCPELDNRIGTLRLPMLDWERDTALTVVLPSGYLDKTLTIAQSTDLPEVERENFIVYPCDVRLYCGFAYESGLIAESFQTAIPAALLFASGVVLLGAFVFSLARGGSDTGLLWAALSVFLWMVALLGQLSFASRYWAEGAVDWNSAYPLLALTALLAFLSSRGGTRRGALWGVTALSGASCIIALFIEWRFTDLQSDILAFLAIDLPELADMAGLALALVFGWSFWRKETRFYALFAPLATAGIVLALTLGLILDAGAVRQAFTPAVAYGYFLRWLMGICTVAAVVSVGVDLVEREIARRSEARMLTAHNELALQSYESLRIQNEQIMMLRHDLAKHLTALRQMENEGQRTAYLDELIGQNEKIRPVVQSGNQMLDILLNGKLSQAISAGVRVELQRCNAPERLPLSDAELCSVVVNLLDNAVAAASAPDVEKPYIRLDMHVKNKFFIFRLENSVGQTPEKSPAPGHGLGLRIVRQILENYEDMIEVDQSGDRCKVTFAIPLSPA